MIIIDNIDFFYDDNKQYRHRLPGFYSICKSLAKLFQGNKALKQKQGFRPDFCKNMELKTSTGNRPILRFLILTLGFGAIVSDYDRILCSGYVHLKEDVSHGTKCTKMLLLLLLV